MTYWSPGLGRDGLRLSSNRSRSPSIPGAWVAPLPVTAGSFATSASTCAAGLRAVAARRIDQPDRHALLVVEQGLGIMRGATRW